MGIWIEGISGLDILKKKGFGNKIKKLGSQKIGYIFKKNTNVI